MAIDFLCSVAQTFYDCMVNSCPAADIPASAEDYFNQKLHEVDIYCGQYYKCTHSRAQIYSYTLTRARARAHEQSRTYIDTHKHTHAHTHIHIN